MRSQTRVVVTGMGIVAPNGIGLDAYWDSLIHCKRGIGPITIFDTADIPVKIAGEVKDFKLHDFVGRDFKPHRLARQTQFGLAACKMAIEHAGLTVDELTAHTPIQLVMGICSGAVDVTEKAMAAILKHRRIGPHTVAACQPHAMSAAIVQMLGLQTNVTTVSAACPSGLDAVVMSARMIKEGRADMIIAGAADSPLNISTMASFCAAGIPSCSGDFPPHAVSRPFDARRTGAVNSEGAGFVVLERLDAAMARGATPWMEIVAGATCSDSPDGHRMDGLFRAMQSAIANAGIHPAQIDYICANAIGDPLGDRAEVDGIKRLLGRRAYAIPVSSIRGVTGHPLAPAGLFQLIACALSLRHGLVVPTANLENPDPDCDLDHVPLIPRHAAFEYVMANGHGMGGENSSTIMRRSG